MAAFLFRRLGAALVLAFLLLTLTFLLIHLAPGGPERVVLDSKVAPADAEQLRRAYGLDRSLPEQYVSWLSAVALEGEWGFSFQNGEAVTAVLARHLKPSLLLAAAALAIQLVVGLLLGVTAARRAGSASDHLIRIGSLLAYAMPSFWLGLMALLLLSHAWPLFPSGQMRSVGSEEWGAGARLLDLLRHLALPALVLGISTCGKMTRFVRNSLLDVLGEDYVRTARAKGVGETTVLWVHALRNALAPVIQVIGLSLPFLVGGALLVEVVFAWPGIGRVMYTAVLARDHPLILAGTALTAVLVVVGNLVADALQALADPRVRSAG